MKYWLCKTEPSAYSIDDLKRDRKTTWTGVRNYQARNYMRDAMKYGDPVLIYHSNADPSALVGLARVCSSAPIVDLIAFDKKSEFFDPKSKQENPTWLCVEVEFVEKFPNEISLESLRNTPELENLLLLRKGNRLSVMPVEENDFRNLMKVSKAKHKF